METSRTGRSGAATGSPSSVDLEPERRTDRGLQHPHRVPDPAQPLLPPRTPAARLGADAEVHQVDGDVARVVHHQVDRLDRSGEDGLRGLLGFEGHADAAREVVAGAERDQSELGVRQVAAAMEGGDDAVQRPVAARDDQPPAVALVQRLLEVGRVVERDGLDRRLRLEDPNHRVDSLTIRRAGARIGEKQEGHARNSTINGPATGSG